MYEQNIQLIYIFSYMQKYSTPKHKLQGINSINNEAISH